MAEFEPGVVEDIRRAMTSGSVQGSALASASENKLVDIGLGSMATTEFCDLNKLVASNTTQNGGFEFICP